MSRGKQKEGFVLAYRRENGSDGLMARLPGPSRVRRAIVVASRSAPPNCWRRKLPQTSTILHDPTPRAEIPQRRLSLAATLLSLGLCFSRRCACFGSRTEEGREEEKVAKMVRGTHGRALIAPLSLVSWHETRWWLRRWGDDPSPPTRETHEQRTRGSPD
jgi:hypothetical protein